MYYNLNGGLIQKMETYCMHWDSDRPRGNSFKLTEGRFILAVRRKSFTQRTVRHWHSCPEKLWCPIPRGAQGQVGWGPGQLSWWGAALPMAGGGAGWALKSFQPKPFYDGTAYKKLG